MEYCKKCGKRLDWKYGVDTITQVGWKCTICNEEWLFEAHEDIGMILKNILERLTNIEEVLGL